MMNALFTIVVPIVNFSSSDRSSVEEGLNAIVQQTIGLPNVDVQLLDCDNEKTVTELCKSYSVKYPGQFHYCFNESIVNGLYELLGSVSGEYTLVYDPRNKMEDNALEVISSYFRTAPEFFDVLTFNAGLSSNINSEMGFGHKFSHGTRTTDVITEPRCLNVFFFNSVMRSSAIKEIQFDTSVEYNLDSYILTCLLNNNPKVGIVKNKLMKCSYYQPFGYGREFSTADEMLQALEQFCDALKQLGNPAVKNYIDNTIIFNLRFLALARTEQKIYPTAIRDDLLNLVKDVLSDMEPKLLANTPGLSSYQRLTFFKLKYDDNDLDLKVVFNNYMIDGNTAFRFGFKNSFIVQGLYIDGKELVITGSCADFLTGHSEKLLAVVNKNNVFEASLKMYPYKDVIDCFGKTVSEFRTFSFRIPLSSRMSIRFELAFDTDTIQLRPAFGPNIHISNAYKKSFIKMNDYHCIYNNRTIHMFKLSFFKSASRWLAYMREIKENAGKAEVIKYIKKQRVEKTLHTANLRHQVAFASARSDEKLLPNLKSVYDAFQGKKIAFTKRTPYSDDVYRQLSNNVLKSKVIVTDDYFLPLRRYGKIESQKVVQIWHAPGAFKGFGVGNSNMDPSLDALYHKDYDLVCVSSEYVRQFYANAFDIDVENVKALGFPRSDRFYDTEYVKERISEVYSKHPELCDKEILLYAPTFRETGKGRVYLPDIPYELLDGVLSDDQILVVCPHPLMPNTETEWRYNHIRLIRDVATDDIMLVSNLMITDYSSVIFEYSLLEKPIVFFCYDYDEYNRDFFLDYDTDLPGDLIKTTSQLAEYLSRRNYSCSEKLIAFREKYMGACDGHSSERIANEVKKMLQK